MPGVRLEQNHTWFHMGGDVFFKFFGDIYSVGNFLSRFTGSQIEITPTRNAIQTFTLRSKRLGNNINAATIGFMMVSDCDFIF